MQITAQQKDDLRDQYRENKFTPNQIQQQAFYPTFQNPMMKVTPTFVFGGGMKVPFWNQMNLPRIQKQTIQNLQNTKSQEEVMDFRQENQIILKSDSRIPDPFITFEDAYQYIPQYLQQIFKSKNFEKPTPIQAQAWPILMEGNNFIGIAQTGSGKTLSYIVPGIMHFNENQRIDQYRTNGPRILILAPTRELVQQIEKEVKMFSMQARMKVVSVFGGVQKNYQINKLQYGCDFLIATPGRLIDLMEQNVVNLRNVTFFILDEADRMLDMGFEQQLRIIQDQIRPDRQTCLWSATWPESVEELAGDFCKDPIHIQISEDDNSVNIDIEQKVILLLSGDKKDRLISLLTNQIHNQKVIIFCQTQKRCDFLSKFLKYEGFQNLAIHGKKTQAMRDYTIEQFKTGNMNVLVATDIASRGLDIKNIEFVINYDFPSTIESYVHRIGRTGRAGNKGISITFFTEQDERLTEDLYYVLKKSNQVIPDAFQQLFLEKKYNKGYKHKSTTIFSSLAQQNTMFNSSIIKNARNTKEQQQKQFQDNFNGKYFQNGMNVQNNTMPVMNGQNNFQFNINNNIPRFFNSKLQTDDQKKNNIYQNGTHIKQEEITNKQIQNNQNNQNNGQDQKQMQQAKQPWLRNSNTNLHQNFFNFRNNQPQTKIGSNGQENTHEQNGNLNNLNQQNQNAKENSVKHDEVQKNNDTKVIFQEDFPKKHNTNSNDNDEFPSIKEDYEESNFDIQQKKYSSPNQGQITTPLDRKSATTTTIEKFPQQNFNSRSNSHLNYSEQFQEKSTVCEQENGTQHKEYESPCQFQYDNFINKQSSIHNSNKHDNQQQRQISSHNKEASSSKCEVIQNNLPKDNHNNDESKQFDEDDNQHLRRQINFEEESQENQTEKAKEIQVKEFEISNDDDEENYSLCSVDEQLEEKMKKNKQKQEQSKNPNQFFQSEVVTMHQTQQVIDLSNINQYTPLTRKLPQSLIQQQLAASNSGSKNNSKANSNHSSYKKQYQNQQQLSNSKQQQQKYGPSNDNNNPLNNNQQQQNNKKYFDNNKNEQAFSYTRVNSVKRNIHHDLSPYMKKNNGQKNQKQMNNYIQKQQQPQQQYQQYQNYNNQNQYNQNQYYQNHQSHQNGGNNFYGGNNYQNNNQNYQYQGKAQYVQKYVPKQERDDQYY